MRIRCCDFFSGLLFVALAPMLATAGTTAMEPVELSSGWQLQDVAKVPQPGAEISTEKFKPAAWYTATVPGTILTSLVNNKVYPEPLYGENNRPENIPESLARTSYWYRTEIEIPKDYAGKHIWLDFEGVNYSAVVWVNGAQVATMRGAFKRGIFDISSNVKAGQEGGRGRAGVAATPPR